jgi:hypothetical protein
MPNKLFLNETQLEQLGFIQRGSGDDPRDLWHEIELFKDAETVTLDYDAYRDFSLCMPDFSIPLNFQTADEVKFFISIFKRKYNHAFSFLLNIADGKDSSKVCGKKNCSEPVYEFGQCFKHYCISEEQNNC